MVAANVAPGLFTGSQSNCGICRPQHVLLLHVGMSSAAQVLHYTNKWPGSAFTLTPKKVTLHQTTVAVNNSLHAIVS